MISDYFTKPLKEKMFEMFCYLIMGYVHINDLLQEIELSFKERLEKSKNVTVNLITNNGKRSYADVCKAPKEKDVE